jgi:hypothetical protein
MSGEQDQIEGTRLRARLYQSVTRLAVAADEQVAYLRSLGPNASPDELALEFDDVVRAALYAGGKFTPPQEASIRRLDEQLEGMSGEEKAPLWTYQALYSASEWAEVRRCASAALDALRQEA